MAKNGTHGYGGEDLMEGFQKDLGRAYRGELDQDLKKKKKGKKE